MGWLLAISNPVAVFNALDTIAQRSFDRCCNSWWASNESSIFAYRNHSKFWTPPSFHRGASRKKLLVGDTTRPYDQIIYKWTANCWQPSKQEVSDKTRTNGRTNERTDNVQIFVSLRLLTSLCETTRIFPLKVISKGYTGSLYLHRSERLHLILRLRLYTRVHVQ